MQERGTGTWLRATPNFVCGTILSLVEFRDETRDRYNLEFLDTSSHCDGRDFEFLVSYALGYKVGCLVIIR